MLKISLLKIYIAIYRTYVFITKVSWCFQLVKIIIDSGFMNIYLSHYLTIYLRPMMSQSLKSADQDHYSYRLHQYLSIYLSHYLTIYLWPMMFITKVSWCSQLIKTIYHTDFINIRQLLFLVNLKTNVLETVPLRRAWPELIVFTKIWFGECN